MTRLHRSRRALQLLCLCTLGLLLHFPGLLLAADPALPAGLGTPTQPALLPSFELPDAQGGILRTVNLQDKVVVIRFWATW